MNLPERQKLIGQILWDCTISTNDIDALMLGEIKVAGHYTRDMIFLRLIESYSWFTILQLFSICDIQYLLTNKLISKLRSPSLRQKYEFVRKRLQQTLPTSG
jgi:hypothetical protein